MQPWKKPPFTSLMYGEAQATLLAIQKVEFLNGGNIIIEGHTISVCAIITQAERDL